MKNIVQTVLISALVCGGTLTLENRGLPLWTHHREAGIDSLNPALAVGSSTPEGVESFAGHGTSISFHATGEFGYVNPTTGMPHAPLREVGVLGFRWRTDPGDVFSPKGRTLDPQFIILAPDNPQYAWQDVRSEVLMTVDADGLHIYPVGTVIENLEDTIPSISLRRDGRIETSEVNPPRRSIAVSRSR